MPRTKSLSAIRAQIRALEKRAQTIEAKADKRITALAKLISLHSLSPADWRQAVALSKGGKRGMSRGAGKPVPVKYADEKGNKWTGRGRPPLWLVAAEKAGRKRESFLLKPAK
ncbi:MAG: H-NS histone family protein [Enhydrobacter sp.]|nr:H-NS histone family protein [Enhydrobacter sp.]